MEGSCVFCDRKNVEERIIAETPTLYYVATLGQITDGGYVIIIPKRHVSCIGAMERPEAADMNRAMRSVACAIHMEYGMKPVIFEHGIVGQTIQHAHLHLMPADISFEPRVRKDFPEAKVDIFGSLETLRLVYAIEREKYLLWNIPARPWLSGNDGMSFFQAAWDPPAPPQYLRIAGADLVGRPERANWRNMDPELDRKLWSETVRRLKPHFS